MSGSPYFYIIRHKPTNKYYAGCKINSDADSSNLLKKDGYKTTSKVVKNYIKTYGLDSFEILKIKHFKTPEETLNYENRFLVKVNAAENLMFLNLHNGGKNFVNKGGYKLKDSTRNKMRKRKSQATIEKQNQEKRSRSKEVYIKSVNSRRANNSLWNSLEAREKIREANIVRFASEESRENQSDIMKDYYKENPVSEETKQKHRILSSGENNGMFGKKDNDLTKEKMKLAWEKRKEQKKNFKQN